MKPDFALDLSQDGLSLLHRHTDGWHLLGEVALDDRKLSRKLRELQQDAVKEAGAQFASKLVIPNSQILYRTLEPGSIAAPIQESDIRVTLDGATPYPLEELAFDWVVAEDGACHVAAVARETLDEAEAFAIEHRFNPVSFVAIPEPQTYPGEPTFGQCGFAETLLEPGEAVEPDTHPITISQKPVEQPSQDQAVDAVPPAPPEILHDSSVSEPEGKISEPAIPDDQVAEPVTFSSRRLDDETAPLIEPDPTRPAARFMLYPEKSDPADDSLPDIGLGNGVKPAIDPAKVAVTAPSLPGEKRTPPKKKKSPPKRQNPPMVAASSRAEPEVTPPPPAKLTGEAKQKTLDGDELTVFGARRTMRENADPLPVGLLAGAGLLVVALLAVLAWLFFPPAPLETAVENNAPAQHEIQTSSILDQTEPEVQFTQPEIQTQIEPPTQAAENDVSNTKANSELTTTTNANVPPPATETGGSDTLAALAPVEPMAPVLDPAQSGVAETGQTDEQNARAIHDQTGIWSLSPVPPVDLDVGRTDGIYIASIDQRTIGHDAIALPPARGVVQDLALPEILSPAPAETTFDLDERGFVRAIPSGALTPDGLQVFLGKPSYEPALRPGTEQAAQPEQPAQTAQPTTRPLARPANLLEIDEKARLGGRTLTQLAMIRPIARPLSAQENLAPVDTVPTELAVLQSVPPTTRPGGFSSIVEKALAEALASAPVETETAAVAAASTPAIPTRASVARAATTTNAINLSRVNLIGIYGSSSDRRALVRLSSGRYVKVQVGDRLDGGKVAAISTDRLQYTKSGRTVTLEIAS